MLEPLELTQIGVDSWGRPVVRDQTGKLWKDINCGEGTPSFYGAWNNNFEGEPDYPMKAGYIIR